MNSRRQFIRKVSLATGALVFASMPAFTVSENKYYFEISLAQWSLHKALFAGKITNLDFPVVAKKEFDIHAVEFVNQFFKDKATDFNYLKELKTRCEDNEVRSLLIMIDQEGNLADKNHLERQKAVENHYKWIEAAKAVNCKSIRVNLHGNANLHEWYEGAVESLSKLAEFGEKTGIDVLAENHGTWSSDASLLAKAVKEVNHKRCKVLVDFANFCVQREKGDLWESPCVNWYDKYKGVEELLPFAGGVSAKTFDFDENGNETGTDFYRMFKLVKQAAYTGYVSVEYEGSRLSEEEGIRKSKALLERIRKEIE